MPFKLRLIKDFQKYLRESREGQDSSTQIAIFGQVGCVVKTGKAKGKRITKKNYNIYQYQLRKEPLEARHVANFYNIIGINEEAVRDNNCPESYFRTLFYLKSVKRIDSRPNYLMLHLVDSEAGHPPIQYIIDRFLSFGDSKFHSLARLISQVTVRLQALEKIKTSGEREQSSDFLERYTQSLGNRMFVCRVSNNKMLISKSLLEELQFSPQQFALETLRFRTPIYEAASSERYFDVVEKYLQNMINLLDLVCDRISLQTFLDSSLFRFRDFFYTKNNKRLFCKIKTGMPHPLITIFELQEILSRSDQFPPSMFYDYHRAESICRSKARIQKSELGSVLSLLELPSNFLPENQHRVPSYCIIQDSVEKC